MIIEHEEIRPYQNYADAQATGIRVGAYHFLAMTARAIRRPITSLPPWKRRSNGIAFAYAYDSRGNIRSKEKYSYGADTLGAVQQSIPYVYGDSNWKDKLTSYNGQGITYDAIGNPLNDGTWMYTWGVGRQLRQMSKSGMTVQFQYDHNGLRIGKTVNGVATNYTLHGKLVMHLTNGSDNLHFFYDAQSRPAKVTFNGVMYTYVHNLQGDIVGLLDSNGTPVVEYKYDTWGMPIGKTGSLSSTLGTLNPFRYRGYVYDEETGFYYVSSRYMILRLVGLSMRMVLMIQTKVF